MKTKILILAGLVIMFIGTAYVYFEHYEFSFLSGKAIDPLNLHDQDRILLTEENISVKNIQPINKIETEAQVQNSETTDTEKADNVYEAFYITSETDISSVEVKVLYKNDTLSNPIYLQAEEDVVQNEVFISRLYNFPEGFKEVQVSSSQEFSIHYIQETLTKPKHISAAGFTEQVEFEKIYKKQLFAAMGVNLITREEWGAPSYSAWYPYYAPVNKFVIHHTALDVDPDRYEAVRKIYNYHKCLPSPGYPYDPTCPIDHTWQDIGYNYLIDPEGRIYEGRSGGNGVAGAHSYSNNVGSIGISIMGNYSNASAPYASLNALRKLVSVLGKLNQFEPAWHQSAWGHREMPNNNTACPGDTLYGQLKSYIDLAQQDYHKLSGMNNTTTLSSLLLQPKKLRSSEDVYGILINSNKIDPVIKQKLLTISRGASYVEEIEDYILSWVLRDLANQFLVQTLLVIPDADVIINDSNPVRKAE